MSESRFMHDEPSNDTAEDLTPTGARGENRESGVAGGEHDPSGPPPDTANAPGDGPDIDRLGHREQDEQRAYSERADRAGTAGQNP